MPEINELDMRARVDEILYRHAAVGLAVGVVRNGRLEFFHGHGVADIASNTPITRDTVFRIASITKTFTAVAVMQLQEEGRIDLDAPASDYLRAYRLLPAKASFRPATVRDLLTHTAGVPQMPHPGRALMRLLAGAGLTESGDSYDLAQPLPTLAEYYGGGLRLAAGHQVHLRQSRVRHARPDRGGCERQAARPLFPRAHLRGSRDGRQRPAAIGPGQVTPGHGIQAAPSRRDSGDRPPEGDRGSELYLLHAGGHGSLRRGSARRRRQRARQSARAGDACEHV
jgi:hypothetical protein